MPSRTDTDRLTMESGIVDNSRRPEVGIDPAKVEELVHPFDDWMLVRMDPPMQSSRGGIALSDSSVPESRIGTVVKAGPGFLLPDGVTYEARNAVEGDRILFEVRAGKTMPGVPDETDPATGRLGYLLVRQGSVCAVIVGGRERREKGNKRGALDLEPGDVRPCGDWTLIRTDRPKGTMESGEVPKVGPRRKMVYPKLLATQVTKARQSERTDQWSGTVVSTGPGRLCVRMPLVDDVVPPDYGHRRAPVRVKKGMRVLFLGDPLNQTIPGIDGHLLVLERHVVSARLGA